MRNTELEGKDHLYHVMVENKWLFVQQGGFLWTIDRQNVSYSVCRLL